MNDNDPPKARYSKAPRNAEELDALMRKVLSEQRYTRWRAEQDKRRPRLKLQTTDQRNERAKR